MLNTGQEAGPACRDKYCTLNLFPRIQYISCTSPTDQCIVRDNGLPGGQGISGSAVAGALTSSMRLILGTVGNCCVNCAAYSLVDLRIEGVSSLVLKRTD